MVAVCLVGGFLMYCAAVAAQQRVGGDDDVEVGGHRHEPVAHRAIRAVLHMHAKAGGEAADLPSPVAHHAGGHDQQRGAGRGAEPLPLVLEQRDELDRLAQTHVVGEAGAEAHAIEEGQPAQARGLVGPQLAVEALGLVQSRHPRGVGRAFQKVRHPPAGVDALHRQAASAAAGQSHRLQQTHLPLAAVLEQLLRLGDLLGPQFDPAAPQPDEGRPAPGLLGQGTHVLGRKHAVADGDPPAEMHERRQPQLRPALAPAAGSAAGGRDLQPRGEPGLLRTPPARGDHVDARLPQQPRELREEPVGLGRAQFHRAGMGVGEHVLEPREHPGGTPELRDQHFLRVPLAGPEQRRRLVRIAPEPLGLDLHIAAGEAARKPPTGAVAGRRDTLGQGRLVGLGQPQHQAKPPLVAGGHQHAEPLGDRSHQARGILVTTGHPRLAGQKPREPGHVRIATGVPALQRVGIVLDQQDRPDPGIDHRPQGLLEDRPGPPAAGVHRGPHLRGHGRDQQPQPIPHAVVVKPRMPGGPQPRSGALDQRRDEPLAGQQVLGQLGDRIPPRESMTEGQRLGCGLLEALQPQQKFRRRLRGDADRGHVHRPDPGRHRLGESGHRDQTITRAGCLVLAVGQTQTQRGRGGVELRDPGAEDPPQRCGHRHGGRRVGMTEDRGAGRRRRGDRHRPCGREAGIRTVRGHPGDPSAGGLGILGPEPKPPRAAAGEVGRHPIGMKDQHGAATTPSSEHRARPASAGTGPPPRIRDPDMTALGLEPRTHRLKAGCSTN